MAEGRVLVRETPKGDIKRRTAEEDRLFERRRVLRNRVDWGSPVNRAVMERWEDLAADSEDEELAVAMIQCIEVMKATVRERDAIRSVCGADQQYLASLEGGSRPDPRHRLSNF